jgi:hypothetical protein
MKKHLTNPGVVGLFACLPTCSVYLVATFYQIQEVSKL